MMKTTIRLFLMEQTDKAYRFSKTPRDRDPQSEGVWVPKSMVECVVWLPEEAGEWRQAFVDMQEWFAEKKGLL
jgi:hypothetical protein